jgi:hypothetical protein
MVMTICSFSVDVMVELFFWTLRISVIVSAILGVVWLHGGRPELKVFVADLHEIWRNAWQPLRGNRQAREDGSGPGEVAAKEVMDLEKHGVERRRRSF